MPTSENYGGMMSGDKIWNKGYELDRLGRNPSYEVNDPSKVHINGIADAEMHRKTLTIAPELLKTFDFNPYNRSMGERDVVRVAEMISAPPAMSMAPVVGNVMAQPVEIKSPTAPEESENRAWEVIRDHPKEALAVIENGLAAAEKEEAPSLSGFPHPAREAIALGLLKEKADKVQLQGYIKEVKEHQKNNDLLLDLNAELTAANSDQDFSLSDKAKATLNELKERGIDLWKGDPDLVPKDKIGALKSDVTGRIQQETTHVQRLLSTEIPPLLSNVMIQALQNILRDESTAIRNTIGKSTNR